MRFLTAFAAIIAAGGTFAHSDDSIITSTLNRSGVVKVIQPEQLEQRLYIRTVEQTVTDDDSSDGSGDHRANAGRKVGGYRVQVFSDNNPRTAKNEARAKARELSQAFPTMRTYVVFTAPYWRLRVGDYKTQEEADAAATRIKKQFPGYAREVRVVRDRINSAK